MEERLKLIIVDDEPRIVQLISMLGHWDEYRIDIVSTCYSGQTAYEQILEKKPDIVITDIQMPVYNGLELIERVHAAGLSDTLFIVLSGYKYFDYARNAISLGVIDYLVKPLDEDQLNEILSKACLRIRKQKESNRASTRLEKLMNEEQAKREREFWNRLISGQQNGEVFPTGDEVKNAFHLQFSHYIIMGYITIESIGQSSFPVIFYDRVRKLIEECIHNQCHYLVDLRENHIRVLMDTEEESSSRRRRLFNQMHNRIRDLVFSYGFFRVTTACSSAVKNTELLPRIATEAEVAAFGRFLFNSVNVLDIGMFSECPRFRDSDLISESEMLQFEEAVSLCRLSEFSNITEPILKRCERLEKYHPADMLHAIQLLIGRFQTNLESGIAIQYDKGLLAGCQNYTDCLRNIFQVMQTQLEKQREEMRQKSRKPVEDAKYFIEMHYGENISQEDVAEYVGLSSVYLSRSFKAETGIGFSDYLTDVRLNHARKMLTDTNLTINQIAETVGYLDSGYFGKIFKKKYGLKPGEFRTMFSRRK